MRRSLVLLLPFAVLIGAVSSIYTGRIGVLREVHRGACRVFDGVLGPAYNEAHRDHLHLDRGGPRVSRWVTAHAALE